MHAAPKPVPAIAFDDGEGRARSLADFHGKVVLLNIWATWCGPCRREMPSLDRLQETLGGHDFEVIALSIDRAGLEAVRKFYADVGIRKLTIYIDSSGKATRELATIGVPATLLIDREGRELGRLVGPAEWDDPDIIQFLKRIVAQKYSALTPVDRRKPVGSRSASPSQPSFAPEMPLGLRANQPNQERPHDYTHSNPATRILARPRPDLCGALLPWTATGLVDAGGDSDRCGPCIQLGLARRRWSRANPDQHTALPHHVCAGRVHDVPLRKVVCSSP